MFRSSFFVLSAILSLFSLALAFTPDSSLSPQPATPTSETNKAKTIGESREWILISKSLDDLLDELAAMQREASIRLKSSHDNSIQRTAAERIRQAKVSKFVLNRVEELQTELTLMRTKLDEVVSTKQSKKQVKNDDDDFGYEQPAAVSAASSTTTTSPSSNNNSSQQEEADKLGFDLEALKRLGEQIGQKLDQFCKDSTKSIAELIESAKLVFKEPKKQSEKQLSSDKVEVELEARQSSFQSEPPETIRGVHQQTVKLVDNIVQSYLGTMRRTLHRLNSFIERRRAFLSSGGTPLTVNRRRHGGGVGVLSAANLDNEETVELAKASSDSALDNLSNASNKLSADIDEFEATLCSAVAADLSRDAKRVTPVLKRASRQSPLWDRIPPRGTELWRDFWDTVRKQARRINQELERISNDLRRALTGGSPSRPTTFVTAAPASLLARIGNLDDSTLTRATGVDADELSGARKQLNGKGKFEDYYENLKLSLESERQKLSKLLVASKNNGDVQISSQNKPQIALAPSEKVAPSDLEVSSDDDDEKTRRELEKNPALRQQIAEEIGAFGGIFDIMRAFVKRLRDAATNIVRDVVSPNSGKTVNNDNNAVTPGPAIKPQVDQLLGETLNSQRNINGQAKPITVPNQRVTNVEQTQVAGANQQQQQQQPRA